MIAAAASPLNRAYLDYNATAPLRADAREAALAAMETTGNPSSVHAEGRAARRIVEDARNEVARLAGVSSRCVTFVSGGTEAANAALNPQFGGGPNAPPLERLIVSAGEHACVLSGHRFPTAEVAPLLRTDASISTGSRPPVAVPVARLWPCRAPITRQA